MYVCACVCFTGPILLDNVGCLGTESSLLEYSHHGIEIYLNCSHYEDAGVHCTSKNSYNIMSKKDFTNFTNLNSLDLANVVISSHYSCIYSSLISLTTKMAGWHQLPCWLIIA